ncbi:hypothetical protein NNC19_18560 [Clostridium sp. SHJSY1]|nr:hypothetical protein [Clostridium sp. SHJSY1]MDS0527695.1 hypothetical protein [Clostridium sp. SHJSY1]
MVNGYVRVMIPRKNIDVTYNPLSTNTKRWPSDWYISENHPGKVWN